MAAGRDAVTAIYGDGTTTRFRARCDRLAPGNAFFGEHRSASSATKTVSKRCFGTEVR